MGSQRVINMGDAENPVETHLMDGNEELGREIIDLASRIGAELYFDLLWLNPIDARREMAYRIAQILLSRNSK